MEETRVHALDYLHVFQRRKWWLLLPILASVLVGALLVRLLPKEYRSTATLGVSAPAVSPDLVKQGSPLDNHERLRALEQQLVSAPILSRLVREEPIGDGTLSEARAIELRRNITFTVLDPVVSTNESRLDTFVVSYGNADPARARSVTNRLVNIFVDENSKTRAEHAQGTAAFIQDQLRDSQARLDNLEAKLRAAKEAHIGRLPEQMQANLQSLSGFRLQHESTASALRTEQDRLSLTVRQIESMQQGSAGTVAAPRSTDASAASPEARVVALERELTAALALYKPIHPEVLRIEDELKSARLAAASDRQRPQADRLAELRLDPAYQQLIADRDMGQMRVKQLTAAEADARQQIAVYQARVEGAPMVEQQLAAVQRDYDLEKTQYSDLSAKLRSATIAEDVEMGGNGEQFTVLYAASLPLEPAKPIPWKVMLMSIMAGVCLGGALTFGREYLDRSVHDVREIKDEFAVPVLGEVNRIGIA